VVAVVLPTKQAQLVLVAQVVVVREHQTTQQVVLELLIQAVAVAVVALIHQVQSVAQAVQELLLLVTQALYKKQLAEL
jgi:hypothetical protein